jgi:ABC-type transport system substrate-binding protein
MAGLRLAAAAAVLIVVCIVMGAGTAGSATPFTLKYAIGSNSASQLAALDPAKSLFQIQWQVEYMTCANLFNHPDVDLSNGGRAVPEVSDGAPTVSADGKTYTFTLKTSYTFSDGTPVTPSSYAAEIARVKSLSGFASYAADIVSASPDDATSKLTITLSAPDADLPDRLAMPIFCPVPPGTGANPTLPLPASGPYMIGPTSSGSVLTLVPNPYYTGSRPHNPSAIEFIQVPDQATAKAGIDSGIYDLADDIGNAGYTDAGANWGPGTANAQAGQQRFFVKPSNSLNYLALNSSGTHTLSNEDLRLAVNYAVDRNGLVQKAPPYAQTPWSQYLTPGIPGFQGPSNPLFPLLPNLVMAQGLVASSGVSNPSVLIYCNGSSLSSVSCMQASAVESNLEDAGFTATVQNYAGGQFFTKIADPNDPFDIAVANWIPDYIDPGNIIVPLLHSGSSQNVSHWDSSSSTDANGVTWRQRMDDASKIVAQQNRYDAFGQLANEITAPAPMAVYAHGNWRFYFSSRIGCQTINPAYGVALGSLCLPDVSQPVSSGGTVSSGTTTSSSDPVVSSVTSPVDGTVSITETQTLNDTAPAGYSFFGQQTTIEAPQASVDSPLILAFTLDSSLLNGADPNTVQLFRNGAPIADCTNPSGATASPDPCVVRPPTANGTGYTYTVRSSEASRWNFGRAFNASFGGFTSPVKPLPTFNKVKAGVAQPVKFSLGSSLGLGIFAAGYPKSVAVACPNATVSAQTASSTAGTLTFDPRSNQYTYAWKTDKKWASTCRQLILRFLDGSEEPANFLFTK